jgi:hypothetical protein
MKVKACNFLPEIKAIFSTKIVIIGIRFQKFKMFQCVWKDEQSQDKT